jgi:hypothetical protein
MSFQVVLASSHFVSISGPYRLSAAKIPDIDLFPIDNPLMNWRLWEIE